MTVLLMVLNISNYVLLINVFFDTQKYVTLQLHPSVLCAIFRGLSTVFIVIDLLPMEMFLSLVTRLLAM